MRTFIRHFLAVFLIASFVPSLQAVTLSLSTNQAVYVPSDTLKLSGGIVPSNDDANVLSDVYVAVVLPDGSIFTLAPNLTWDATLTPILKAFPIANIQAPNFYSLSIPESLPKGTYTFYLVATPTNSNPLDSSLWLGSITTTINISTTPTCTPPQVLQNNLCVTPTPTCTSPQVLQNGVCVIPLPGITPTINQLYPTQASSATKVVVNGSGFTSLSKITLGTQAITPEFVSDTQLSFVVPFGLNQNGALIPFQAGEYPVKVDDSDPVNFTVIDLPDNPNPPGQLLASQVNFVFQQLAVVVPEFQAKLPQLLSEQQGNPGAQKFIQDLVDLANYINSPSVQAELTSLTNQIDLQSLDTLERSLSVNLSVKSNTALANAAINSNTSKRTATIQHQQAATSNSCYTLTNGDDWLECRRNNIKTNIEGINTPSLEIAQLSNSLSKYTKVCVVAAIGAGIITIEEFGLGAVAVGRVCKMLNGISSIASTLYTASVAGNAGTLRGFEVNIAGFDKTIDTTTDTTTKSSNLSLNPTELTINLHLNNYDNYDFNKIVTHQTTHPKYIDGAILHISMNEDWAKLLIKLNTDIAPLAGVTTKIPVLDTAINKLLNLLANRVNNTINQPNKSLQISKAYISSRAPSIPSIYAIDAGVGGGIGTCNQFTYQTVIFGDYHPGELQIEQNTELQWLVKNENPVAQLGKYIDTLNGCNYMINETYRLPSEDDIVTKIQFSIKRYPKITINVKGSGYVTYEVPPLSGHQSCTRETSPCTEYFDFSPKPSLPADPNYTNVKLTAYNSDGTEAGSTTWTGDKTENCTDNASCLITPDATNMAPPVITATTGSACEIGKLGPAGGIIFYCDDTGKHGLEAAPEDQTPSTWGCWVYNAAQKDTQPYYGFIATRVGPTSAAIGTGAKNTTAIIAACGTSGGSGSGSGFGTATNAAATASAYTLNGYHDWYLPSREELNQLQIVVGTWIDNYYWSSTDASNNCAWSQSIFTGEQRHILYQYTLSVRAIRAF